VRIWKVKPGNDGFYPGRSGGGADNADGAEDDNNSGEEEDDPKWTASVVADFDQHRSSVGRVEWNITG
jgi:nucleoporin SEH1